MHISGFDSIREMDQHYGSAPPDPRQKESAPDNPNSGWQRSSENSQGRGSEMPRSIEEGKVPVEFSAKRKEFNEAVKCLLAGASRTEQDLLEFADINARTSGVEFVTTGTSSGLLAEVRSTGYARVPLAVFKRISRAIRMLREDTIEISIGTGIIKVAKLLFSHPEISLRLIGARVADLPLDAPLPDVLALSVRFRAEEIEDRGLLARVLAAQAEASKLIDQGFKTLEPLGIQRAALSRFVSEQIEKRAREGKNLV